jgi:hypothetical protein
VYQNVNGVTVEQSVCLRLGEIALVSGYTLYCRGFARNANYIMALCKVFRKRGAEKSGGAGNQDISHIHPSVTVGQPQFSCSILTVFENLCDRKRHNTVPDAIFRSPESLMV